MTLNLQQILAYLEGDIEETKRIEIREYLASDPYYANVLYGLYLLREEVEDVEDYLAQQKANMRGRLGL